MVNQQTNKQKDAVLRCIYCNQEIAFDSKIRSPKGKWIPLNLDKSKHDCPKSPYQEWLKRKKNGDAGSTDNVIN